MKHLYISSLPKLAQSISAALFISIFANLLIGTSVFSQNGLWQAIGSDTVTTNRNVAVTKNMKVDGLLIADSIKTKNGNLTVTDSVTIKTYTRIEDSVRILGPLKVGEGTLTIGNTSFNNQPDNITSSNGELFITNTNSPFNNIKVNIGYTTSGTAKLAVNGNAGINTSSPTEILDVDGNARIRQIPVFSGTAGASQGLVISNSSGNSGTLNKINFNGNTNTFLNGAGGFTTPSGGGGITSSCTTVNFVPKMGSATNLVCSSIFESGGNVGIGTTSPDAKLVVEGTVFPMLQLKTTTTTDLALDLHRNNNRIWQIRTIGTDDLFFRSFPSQVNRMVILNSNGFVGIGTDMPVARLEVAGSAIVDKNSGTDPSLFVDAFTNRVGIGISSPQTKLHIEATGSEDPLSVIAQNGFPTASFEATGTDVALLLKKNGNNIWQIRTIGTNDLFFRSFVGLTGTNRMVITNANGLVGIGIDAPAARLHIQNPTGSNAILVDARNSGGTSRFSVANNGDVRAPNLAFQAVPTGLEGVYYNTTTGQLIHSSSSQDVKENISDITFNRDSFYLLQPRDFTWKSAVGGFNDVGLVAEEVAEVMPDVATYGYKRLYNSDGSLQMDTLGNVIIDSSQVVPQSIDYRRLTTYMLAAIKDLKDSIMKLNSKDSLFENALASCCNAQDSVPSLRTRNNQNSNGKQKNNDEVTATSISLEHTYPLGTIDYGPLYRIQLKYAGTKYVALKRSSTPRHFVIYNLDHTIYKQINVNLTDDWDGISYISDGLFDSDTLIEYMTTGGNCSYVKIFKEDGSLLWEESDCQNGCVILWPLAISDTDPFIAGPIMNTDSGTKMAIHTNYCGAGSPQSIIKIYALPGSLVIGQTGLEIYNGEIPAQFKIYPNPSGNSATVEYSLPQGESKGEIVITNLMGSMVKKLVVGSGSNKIELDNTQLPAGTYFYQLQTDKGVAGTKKMMVVR